MPRQIIFVTALVTCAFGTSAEGQDPNPFESGLALYRENKIEASLPLFEAAAESQPENAEVRAYLAETLRRLDRHTEAAQHVRAILARVPCHSFAHTILGFIYSPQYSGWEYPNADSAWAHFLAAVECDADFGEAWLMVLFEAMRRGEHALEERALRRIVETGFLTPATLAYNRWVLTTLPDRALLLTNGDWDTYPVLALQVVEQLRSDVAVVNISMLQLPWYVRVVHERYGMPLGYDPDFPVWVSRIIGNWRRMSVQGEFGRPLHAALTVAQSSVEGLAGTWQLAGPSWRLVASQYPVSVDTAAVRTALEGLQAGDLVGPATSPADRSPLRIAAGNSFPFNALYVASQYGYALLENGRWAEAEQVADWADAFVVQAGIPDSQEYVDELRKAVEERRPE